MEQDKNYMLPLYIDGLKHFSNQELKDIKDSIEKRLKEEFFEKNADGKFYYFTTKAQKKYTDICYTDNVYIVFGREDKGIDEDILYKNPDTCVRMPMLSNIRSLNLSNTVAIATYEILRQWDFEGFETQGNLTKYNWE